MAVYVYSSDGFRFRDLQVMSPMSQPQTSTPPPAKNHLIRSFSRISLFSSVRAVTLFLNSSGDSFASVFSGSLCVGAVVREVGILDWVDEFFSDVTFITEGEVCRFCSPKGIDFSGEAGCFPL